MSDTKMLQAILDRIVVMNNEINSKLDKLDKKVDGVEQRLTERIDRLGSQLAYLEDDAPTNKEFNKLERRVSKIEKQLSSV